MNKHKIFVFTVCFVGAVLIAVLTFGENGDDFSEIVRSMGYNPENEIYEAVEFTIPETFNDVYIRYNKLQKQGGFDLEKYTGKKCVRYTYLIPDKNARANIIVYNGKVIGGDISGITLDGIMIPLQDKGRGNE